ncbi:hypothetical protein [Mycolicibacter minnesotensis]
MPDDTLIVDPDELNAAAKSLRAQADEIEALATASKSIFDDALEPASEVTTDGEPAPIRVPAVEALTRAQTKYVAVAKRLVETLRADALTLEKQAQGQQDVTDQAVSDVDEIVTI